MDGPRMRTEMPTRLAMVYKTETREWSHESKVGRNAKKNPGNTHWRPTSILLDASLLTCPFGAMTRVSYTVPRLRADTLGAHNPTGVAKAGNVGETCGTKSEGRSNSWKYLRE